MAGIFWHNLSSQEVIKTLKTNSKRGLMEKEIEVRQKEFGRNSLPEEEPLSGLKIFLRQIKSPLIFILLIAGLITLFLREYADSIIIFGAAILNISVSFIQENKASQALKKLKKATKSSALVQRQGNLKIIDSQELVPGDIVILNPGDKVPADGRIIEANTLKLNEMALTGEWLPADKIIDSLSKETPLADRDNMVYMGTVVEDGKAKIVVTEIGIQTEVGKIAKIVKETEEEKTPYQKKLARFSKALGAVIAIICLAIFLGGMARGEDFTQIFTTAVAVAVASIPEGLALSLTVILALGMQRILKQGGLVRKLAAAETLGGTSIIATDKTGTLTEGKMKPDQILTANQLLTGDKDNNSLLLRISTLCNEAFIENPKEDREKWIVRGRPTDKGLLLAGLENGIDKKKLEKELKKIQEIPFNSVHKYAAHLYQTNSQQLVLYLCGAPEKILSFSSRINIKGKAGKLTEKRVEKIEDELKKLTSQGLRVIAIAHRRIKKSEFEFKKTTLEIFLEDLIFVGFICLKDPLREDAKKAIRICKQAGMRPIIITGDHKLTAKAIALELKLPVKEKNVIEGKDLDKLSEKEFQECIKEISVYARVEPKHKMRIIRAWQERGEIVAMTGDGINDAPALKKADIGIALGSGTDVAKEISDLVLLTNNFSIIVAAVEEGRRILDNIRKVITYLLSDSFTETILVGVSIIFGLPLPISAAQILWVNLIEDGLPDIALAFEPKEKGLMRQTPQGHDSPLLTKEMKVIIFAIGIISDLMLLGLFWWFWQKTQDIVYVRTIVFAALAIDSLLFVFSCKSLRKNLWQINIFSNKLLNISVLIGILMLIFAIYLPPFQTLLKTVPLGSYEWSIIISLGLAELILIEITKHHFIIKKQAL